MNDIAIPPDMLEKEAELRALRQDLHAHPELGFQEARTSEIVGERLAHWGYGVHRGLGGTGVVGTLRCGTSQRTLGLRADMDALPVTERNLFGHASRHAGCMHAAGTTDTQPCCCWQPAT